MKNYWAGSTTKKDTLDPVQVKDNTVAQTYGRSCCGGRSMCINQDFKNRTSFVPLSGFKDWYCTVNWYFMHINQQTGEQKKRDILPHETVWVQYEKIFTQNYSNVSPEYKKFLDNFKDEVYPDTENEGYVRVWTKPVTSYATNYSKFDISLAPIKNHIFNRMKSQLKVIEAGFYKKALIASNLGPYTIDLKHCLEHGNFVDGNALLVDENRNHSDWAKFIEKLLKNRNLVTDMGERLYETVKDKYNLSNVTKQRAEFYKSIL